VRGRREPSLRNPPPEALHPPDLAGGSYRLCAADHCSGGRLKPAGLLSARVELPEDIGARSVTVRLRLTTPGAHSPSVDQSTTTTLIRTDTTGEGAYYWRALALTPAGGLSESVPSTGRWDPKNEARPPAGPEGSLPGDASRNATGGDSGSPSP
jgi:hypothetical protein